MQRVIEAARAQSYAAFMQPNPSPLPAIVPAAIPSAVPDIKKDDSKNDSKRDRRRSRSRSRDRKDRSRDRDRNRRHRDRSRSRDRRDRRRRDRSRSRGRSRSKDRDRRNNSRDNSKRSDSRNSSKDNKPKPQVWSNQIPNDVVSNIQPASLLGNFPLNLDDPSHLSMLNAGISGNGFMPNNFNNNRGRESWPQTNFPNNQPGNFQNFNNFHPNTNMRGQMHNNLGGNRGFQRNDNYDQYDDNEPIDQNSCVQLESFFGGYGDVRRFFQGIFISNKGIKFLNDENGKRTGVVYVQFGHRQGKLDALRKNGEILNGAKVQVSHLEDDVFDEAVDRYIPQQDYYNENNDEVKNVRSNSKFKLRGTNKFMNNDESDIKDFSCLMVEDLPTYVKEQDILHMFSAHPLFSLILTSKPRGGHIAYVKFSNKEVAKMAFEEKSHHVVGGKPVTVLPCTDEDFEKISEEHDPNLESNNIHTNIGTDCLSISRLPLKTKDKDIADFFSDIGVIPTKIHLMSSPLGNFTGQAYCVFDSIKDASLASQKDETMLGNVPISVKPIMHAEMQSILNNLTPTQNSQQLQNQNVPDNRLIGAPMMLNRPPMMSSQHQNRPFFNRNFDGPPRGPRFGHRGGGPGGGPRHRFGGYQHGMNNAPMDGALPGCTVFMDNVPYKAGTNEILEFFDGYDITNNVSRRYNTNNTPSAEAKVIFNSPEEAFRAVKEKNGHKIWERPIYLKQA